MEIRKIKPDEREGLLALYHLLHPDDIPPEEEKLESVWKAVCAGDRVQCFVAAENGGIVGSCMLAVVPNLTRGCRPYALIENVVVRQDCRRRGIGRALIERALVHAWEHRCYKVMLMSEADNASAHRFYRSCGFDPDRKQAFIQRRL